jgi:hypothetical protein
MHELGLTQSIVEIVGEHARGRKVKRVTLELGKFSGVMSGSASTLWPRAPHSKALPSKSFRSRPAPDASVVARTLRKKRSTHGVNAAPGISSAFPEMSCS